MHLSPCNNLWIRSQAALHQHKHLTSHTNWLPTSANVESRLSVTALIWLAHNLTFKSSSICLLLRNETHQSQGTDTWTWGFRCKRTQQITQHPSYAEWADYKPVWCFWGPSMPSPWGPFFWTWFMCADLVSCVTKVTQCTGSAILWNGLWPLDAPHGLSNKHCSTLPDTDSNAPAPQSVHRHNDTITRV